jgi:hypothetical protein
MKSISIQKIGPIEYLEIPIPENGGVVVLRGRNGLGKSWALQAVDCLASGRGSLPVRDGATRGTVSGAGVTLTVEKSVKRSGTAEVVSLDGRFDISEFVTPPIADPEAADKRRIKALLQLSGEKAKPEEFTAILPPGVTLDELVPAAERSDDPVVLAGQIKRALEEEARRYERALQQLRAEVDALQKQIPPHAKDHEITEDDRAQALNELQEALALLTKLETQLQEAERLSSLQGTARAQLAELQRDYKEPEAYDSEIAELDTTILQLEQQLAAAKERKKQLLQQKERATQTRNQLLRLQEILDKQIPLVPEAELSAARKRREAAQAHYDNVIKGLEITKLVKKLRDLEEAAKITEERAVQLRNAAWATDTVLTAMVARVTNELRIQGGRLVVESERGAEFFADLSVGERWAKALSIFATMLPPQGIMVAKQEAWESLDPINKKEIVTLARQLGVTIFTAEADDSEKIRVEVLQ